MRIAESEIEKAFGTGAERNVPGSAAEAALHGIQDLDAKLADIVEKHRRADESHAQAQLRAMDESPRLFEAYEAARAKVMKVNGYGAGTGE